MKTTLTLLVLSLLVLSAVPSVFAISIGSGVDVDIETEDFAPLVWMCDDRVVYDDATEPGRMTLDGQPLIERMNNYAFEGEQIQWNVLVMDKNGIEKISDVYATIGDSQGDGNDIEVNCQRVHHGWDWCIYVDGALYFESENNVPAGIDIEEAGFMCVPRSCNARILEEKVYGFDDDLMDFYQCTLTVETPDSMQGEYWMTVEAEDLDGLLGTMDENEYWFLNPEIALSIDGDLVFEDVRPGTSSYSSTLLIGNDAEDSSGVRMDMFISGTDFYDSSSSGAMCPTTNQLSLGAFSYFATHGAYSTQTDSRSDVEGYVPITYGIGFNDPTPFYDAAEIMQTLPKNGPYYQSNILSPGSEMAVTLRLDLPEPCNGDFDTGQIFFWGEAI